MGEARKVFLAIPCYSAHVTTATFLSVVTAMTEASALRVGMDVHCLAGDADLARCRNALLGEFLRSDHSDLVFVDADISWGPGTFARLLAHGVDFVCGVYRARTDEQEIYPVHWPPQKRLYVDPQSKQPLLEADMAPGGFWRLSRACVERIAKDAVWVTDKLFPVTYPWVFDFTFDGKVRRSEDFTFCRKWQACGGQVWVDPAIRLGHSGMKLFEGDLAASLAREVAAYCNEAGQSAAELARRALAVAGG